MPSTRFQFDRDKALRNLRLRILEYAVQDDHVTSVLGEIARAIRTSEQACDKAALQATDDPDYVDAICDEETANIEEAAGVAFLILQMKIRRVVEAAKYLYPRQDIMKRGGNHRTYPHSLIKLIWEVANYYKHRDEWSAAVWERGLKQNNPELYKKIRVQIRAREVVECLGIVMSSTGNLRTSLESLGVSPYSDCKNLAAQVQTWAREF